MRWLARLMWRFASGRHAPPRQLDDPIHERLHAAVDANTAAKDINCRCYRSRVEAMADDFFRRMDEYAARRL